MSELNEVERKALQYVQNTGGLIEARIFRDDHDPIGADLQDRLLRHGVVEELEGPKGTMLAITTPGLKELGAP